MILSTRAWSVKAGAGAFALLAGVLAAPIAAGAVTVTLQPSAADARIDQASATTNFGSDTTMQVRSQNGGAGRNARSQVQFDVSSIPANAVINSATLQLYMITAPAQSRTYEARRITGAWSEATVTWQGAPSFSNGATATAATGTTSGVWRSWAITTDVQAWVNGTANYGTLIKDTNESSNQANIRADFATAEYSADPSKQPILVVDYQPAYSITLPAGSAVVMSEPTLVNFTVTNVADASATETIAKILLTFPYPVASAVPPAGWKVTDITGNQVMFDTELASEPGCSASALAGGQAAVFGVYLTAPAAAAEAANDTLSSATVGNDCVVAGFWSYTFDRSGGFPTWARRGLGATLVATPSTTGVNGTVTLTMAVTNRTTGAQNAIAPAAPTVTGGAATLLTGPTPASANLAAGASQSFVWTFRPTTTGTFSFSSSATNGTVRTINPVVSNDVLVGPLTASLAVTPIQPTNGSQVTVTMTVTNNGASPLTSITPSALTTGGTATATLVSGPTPASLTSLAAGASTSFLWTYTVSGAVGDTFAFTGNATASGGVTSNTDTSPMGNIASMGVAISPASVPVTAAATLTYTVTNQTGDTIRVVTITAPSTAFVYSSSSAPAGWQASAAGTPTTVTFTSQASGNDIADGASLAFVVTWSAVPSTVGSYTFQVDAATRSSFLNYNRSASISVTQYSLTIAASPTAIPGDGQSATTITATLRNAGTPVNGATVSFSATLGTLSGVAATTNASGQAQLTLTAIATSSDLTSTITVTYGALTSAQTTVTFQGLTLSLSPASASVDADGQSTVALTLTFRYTTSGAAISGASAAMSVSGAGSASPASATSSSSGIAITYTAPAASSDGSATVTATYRGLTASSAMSYRGITLALTPATATVDADGQSTAALTLTFRYATGGGAIAGATATISRTGSGSVAPASASSSASSIAVTYTAPVSGADGGSTVTATYRGLTTSSTVTYSGITLSLTPATATVDADGQSTAALTLTFRYATGGGAIAGATATITRTGSGAVSPASASSSASGIAVTYTAPASSADGTATVTAAYRGLTASSTIGSLGITLDLSPASATVDADGQSTTALTLTFRYTTGGGAVPGATATIANAGLGSVSPTSAASASGTIAVTYVAPASSTDGSATVTASYRGLAAASSAIGYKGITLALSPATATVDADGQSTAAFTLTARYTTAGTALPASTTLAVGPVGVGSVAPASASAVTTAVTFTAAAQSAQTAGTITATYRGLTATASLTLRMVTITLAASPAAIVADGTSTSAITATLTIGGSVAAGGSIAFATTSGAVAPSPLVTSAAGQAVTTLTSAVSAVDLVATVTATYKGVTSTVDVAFTAVALSLAASPASIAADGATTTTLTATMTSGGGPLSGRTVSFGTAGATLSAATAVTNLGGQATVTLRSTVASKSTTTPSVTASIGGVTATVPVTLTGITLAEPGELTVVSSAGMNTIYWAWPATGYVSGIAVLRRTGAMPAIPGDGAAVSAGDSLADGSRVVVKQAAGPVTAAIDGGLTPGTTYYYRALVYFTSGALYSATGKSTDAPGAGGAGPQWVSSTSAPGLTTPLADGMGGLYWTGASGGVIGSATTDGTWLWPRALSAEIATAPPSLTSLEGLGDGQVVVGTATGSVAVVDVATGNVVWQTAALGDAIGGTPGQQWRVASDATYQGVYAGDLIIVGTQNASATNNKVYALDGASGAVAWTFNAGGATPVDQITGGPWVDHDRNRVVVTTKSNGGTQPSVWVLSTLDGSLVSSFSLGDVTGTLVWGMEDVLFVPVASGKLYALDLASGTLKWAAPLDLGAGNAMIGNVWEDWALPGTLFITTQDGRVWAAQSSGGGATPTVLWQTPVSASSEPFVLGTAGVLYVGGSDGAVHQVRLADGVDEKQQPLGTAGAAVGILTWDWQSGWLYAPTADGKVYAIGTPLP